MATFGEIVYACMDLLKVHSDDSYYTEEHIIFLASKMRALLLERKYRGSRNSVYKEIPEENKQRICLNLEVANDMGSSCSGDWLRSVEEIPDLVSGTELKVFPVNDMLFTNVSFVPAERMPYVGYNKWLKNILYCSKAANGHLYMHGNNPQFMFMDKIEAEGVFADPAEAGNLSCGNSDGPCDIMDQEFPLEEGLQIACIEYVVQELSGARFAPQDKNNNAEDDLAKVGSIRNTQPVTRYSDTKPIAQEETEQ